MMFAPGRSTSSVEMVTIDPQELKPAQERDEIVAFSFQSQVLQEVLKAAGHPFSMARTRFSPATTFPGLTVQPVRQPAGLFFLAFALRIDRHVRRIGGVSREAECFEPLCLCAERACRALILGYCQFGIAVAL
jgi:hypothetical protein